MKSVVIDSAADASGEGRIGAESIGVHVRRAEEGFGERTDFTDRHRDTGPEQEIVEMGVHAGRRANHSYDAGTCRIGEFERAVISAEICDDPHERQEELAFKSAFPAVEALALCAEIGVVVGVSSENVACSWNLRRGQGSAEERRKPQKRGACDLAHESSVRTLTPGSAESSWMRGGPNRISRIRIPEVQCRFRSARRFR